MREAVRLASQIMGWTIGRRRSCAFVACLAAAFAFGLAASVAPVRAEDPDAAVAAALLKSGKAAVQKKSWDEALTLFDRALRETPDLIEAEFQRGVALERKGDRTAAVAAYRRFLDRLKEKAGAGSATPEETALGPQAEKRVAFLAQGEQELAKLEDQFASQLLAFAKKHREKDRAIADRALRTLLDVRPDHAEARSLLGDAGAGDEDGGAASRPAPAAPDTGPFAKLRVAQWDDFIATRRLTAAAIVYEEPGFVIDTETGKVITPSAAMDYGLKYAYECEFRVTEEKERGWLVGLVFAEKEDDLRTAFVQRGQVVLSRGKLSSGPSGDEGAEPLKNLDLAAWHRLGVRVDGSRYEVWFDGKKVLQGTDSVRVSLDGDLGLFQQRCRVEWRLLRAGRVE